MLDFLPWIGLVLFCIVFSYGSWRLLQWQSHFWAKRTDPLTMALAKEILADNPRYHESGRLEAARQFIRQHFDQLLRELGLYYSPSLALADDDSAFAFAELRELLKNPVILVDNERTGRGWFTVANLELEHAEHELDLGKPEAAYLAVLTAYTALQNIQPAAKMTTHEVRHRLANLYWPLVERKGLDQLPGFQPLFPRQVPSSDLP